MSEAIPIGELLGHDPFVRRLAHSLVQDDAAAEDAVQETWRAALESGPRDRDTARGWLATVVRNAVRMRARGEGRRIARETVASRSEVVAPAAQIAEREALRRKVVEAVLALPEPNRTAVLMRFYEGLPPRAIARRVDAPTETVRSRVRAGLARVRESLDAEQPRATWVAGIIPLARLPQRAGTSVSAATLLVVASVTVVGVVTWLLLREADTAPMRTPDREDAMVVPQEDPTRRPPRAARTMPFAADGVSIVRAEESNEVFPDAEPYDASGSLYAATATRIVDAVTGQPLEGVTVSAVTEPHCAIPDRWEPLREVTSGKDGWARMRLEDLPDRDVDWWFYQAPGYAPQAHFSNYMEFPIRLKRGVDVPILAVDENDRPVDGVKVGVILGCGHTPNVRRVITDATGRATIPCIDPQQGELWPVKMGFLSEYSDIAWRPGDPPMVIRLTRSPVIEGLVVDFEGKPVPNAFVGSPQCHRGPWTRADANGRFALPGADWGANLYVYAADDEHGRPLVVSDDVASGTFRVVRLSADPHDTDEHVGERAPVRVVMTSNGSPVSGADLRLVHAEDGWTQHLATDESGVIEKELPIGRYAVAFRSPLSIDPWRTTADLVVGVDTRELRIELGALVPLRFVLDGWEKPRYGAIRLVGTDQLVDVPLGETVLAPPDTPLRVRIDSGVGRPRFANLLPGADGRCLIPRPRARPLVVQLRDTDGRATAGWARVLERDAYVSVGDWDDRALPRSEWVLDGDPSQDLILYAVPRDQALSPSAVELSWPARPEDPVIVTFERGIGFVDAVLPDGRRIEPEITVEHEGFTEDGWYAGFRQIPSGANVRVTRDGMPALTRTLEGPGPWTLSWSRSEVRLDVADDQGEPMSTFEVFVDDMHVTGEQGRAVLRGLPVGTHELVVAARGYRAWKMTIRIDDPEGGSLKVTMRK